jgi:hypothetical protein
MASRDCWGQKRRQSSCLLACHSSLSRLFSKFATTESRVWLLSWPRHMLLAASGMPSLALHGNWLVGCWSRRHHDDSFKASWVVVVVVVFFCGGARRRRGGVDCGEFEHAVAVLGDPPPRGGTGGWGRGEASGVLGQVLLGIWMHDSDAWFAWVTWGLDQRHWRIFLRFGVGRLE